MQVFKRITISIALFLSVIFSNLFAQSFYSIDFIENKGQWEGDFFFKGNIGSGTVFLERNGYTVVLYNNDDVANVIGHKKVSSLINKVEPVKIIANEETQGESEKIHLHSYKVNFIGSNPSPEIFPEKPSGEISNYFLGNDPSKWKKNVQGFNNVVVKNLYQGIDIRYYSDNGSLKYDLIVHPGADVSKIKLSYNGVNSMNIKDGELILETSLGQIKERSPYSYQIINGIKKEVDASYQLNENFVQYKIKRISEQDDIIIDPVVQLATFTGSVANNWGFTAAPGPDGSLYAGGVVYGPNYATETGAYQVDFKGGQPDKNDPGDVTGVDIGLTRFSPDGSTRIYSTYLGGIGNEYPHSIYVNNNGEAVVLGRTSSANFPYIKKFGPGGNTDIFVTKLSADGSSLIGSALIGGTGNDGENIKRTSTTNGVHLFYGDNARSEVIVDLSDNIYVAASSNSSDFLTKNAFQNVANGLQDGVVMKFDPTLSNILFSTYLGGNADDAAISLAQDPLSKNIYVTGASMSKNFPVSTSGVLGASQNGGVDGFVSVFDENGNWIRGSFLGTNLDDYIYGVQFDNAGYPYVLGVSFGNWRVTANAVYKNPGSKQFISKLQPDLSDYVYSTVFGISYNEPTISPVAFLVDRCENVYVSAWSVAGFCSTNINNRFLPVSSKGLLKPQNNFDNKDFYFFVLQKDAQAQLYGTLYGQQGGEADHVDGGTSRFDKNGVIYQAICANCFGNNACNSQQFRDPVTYAYTNLSLPNSVARANGSTGCNLFAVKIDFELSGVKAGIKTYADKTPYKISGCAPFTVDFTDTIGMGKTFEWDFNDGNTATGINAKNTFKNPGVYNVRLITKDPARSCGPVDTQFVKISVGLNKVDLKFTVTRPDCNSRNFIFTNNSVPEQGGSFGPNSFEWSFGDNSPKITRNTDPINHIFQSDGTYNISLKLLDPKYCNTQYSYDSILSIAFNTKAVITANNTVCLNPKYTNKPLSFKGSGGQTYEWLFSDDNSKATGSNVSHLFKSAGKFNVQLIATDPNLCKTKDTAAFTVNVVNSPTAQFSYSPKPAQENTPVSFTNLSKGADASIPYKWLFGDGVVSSETDPSYLYRSTAANRVLLIAYNQYQCTDTATDIVNSVVRSQVEMPNAFTPNGDGKNDKYFVRGFGIAKMDLKIFNRYGEMVFQTFNPLTGWDGKNAKGIPQPMDAYAYTLIVEFSDGTSAIKKGDITLIR